MPGKAPFPLLRLGSATQDKSGQSRTNDTPKVDPGWLLLAAVSGERPFFAGIALFAVAHSDRPSPGVEPRLGPAVAHGERTVTVIYHAPASSAHGLLLIAAWVLVITGVPLGLWGRRSGR